MKTALDILGFPCYHSTDLWVDKQENIEIWTNAFDWKYNKKGKFGGKADFDKVLANHMVRPEPVI